MCSFLSILSIGEQEEKEAIDTTDRNCRRIKLSFVKLIVFIMYINRLPIHMYACKILACTLRKKIC